MTAFDKKYLEVIRQVQSYGTETDDRTGVGTTSLTGVMLAHDMNEGFPLLTIKKLYYKLAFGETEFFLRGKHNKDWLHNHPSNIKIWDEWCDNTLIPGNLNEEERKEFARKENELGPIYGAQWTKFSTPYIANEEIGVINVDVLKRIMGDYGIKLEVNQIQNLLDQLASGKSSRRMYVTAMNPAQAEFQALEPCHVYFQVLRRGNRLDLFFLMRSTDVVLGLPFNIASYALILELLCNMFGLVPGKLTYCGVDVHIYKNHEDAVKELQQRKGYDELPRLEISDDFKTILDFDSTNHVKIVNYQHDGVIKAPVAI